MGQRVLLVEGKDDLHVAKNLFQIRGVPEVFRVETPAGGAEKTAEGLNAVLESIPARLLETDLERLAVVLDADDKGPAARWQSIRLRLINKGYRGSEIPEQHQHAGTVFDLSLLAGIPRSVRLATWFMPDNRAAGMVEDFVAGLIRGDDAMLPRVDQFLNSIPKSECRFSPSHLPKARIHTWLAVSECPGRPMGQAIQWDRSLDANHPSAQPFLDWVHKALID
jgi:hypothetical protein